MRMPKRGTFPLYFYIIHKKLLYFNEKYKIYSLKYVEKLLGLSNKVYKNCYNCVNV